MTFKLITPNMNSREFLKEMALERRVLEEELKRNYDFEEFDLKDFDLPIKPVFLTGDIVHIHSRKNPEFYVVDSKVLYPTNIDSGSSRNVPPIPHANQGDFRKAVGETLWLLGNFDFSTWNNVHAAASKNHTGFLSIGYKGKNFGIINPDTEYGLRTIASFDGLGQYASILHDNEKPLAYIKGQGQTQEHLLTKK